MINFNFLKRVCLFIFRERGREGERDGEKHQCVVASHMPPTGGTWPTTYAPNWGDLAHNPGMCPDWESNQRPFGLQAGMQSTEPHQPGPKPSIFNLISLDRETCSCQNLCLEIPHIQIVFPLVLTLYLLTPKPKVSTQVWNCMFYSVVR